MNKFHKSVNKLAFTNAEAVTERYSVRKGVLRKHQFLCENISYFFLCCSPRQPNTLVPAVSHNIIYGKNILLSYNSGDTSLGENKTINHIVELISCLYTGLHSQSLSMFL